MATCHACRFATLHGYLRRFAVYQLPLWLHRRATCSRKASLYLPAAVRRRSAKAAKRCQAKRAACHAANAKSMPPQPAKERTRKPARLYCKRRQRACNIAAAFRCGWRQAQLASPYYTRAKSYRLRLLKSTQPPAAAR
ncbi:hypothetical protein NPIL_224921 [Nephila pilipes]|uniref:Uncharacterized protein n=1 Tax=Nephila pilipes TaxID=299642 RepID=A0A8X6NXD8_NEPPI|nr:hypothetical protein NPIL_224921 [Nephila pilipes]